MKFCCKPCIYATDVKFAYEKHLKSIRHSKKIEENAIETQQKHNKRNVETNFQCLYCTNYYSTASSLARHHRSCGKKNTITINYTNEIEKYKAELNHMKEIEQHKDEMNKQLKDEVVHLKSLINNAGAIIKTSVSALAYVTQYYKDAPELDKLDDYSYLEYDDENDEFDLTELIISHYKDNLLCQYLGNVIINVYKKDNPAEQSIWNSDSVRLTYIIKDIINKKTDWAVDKKGVKTTKYIIDPLLEYLRTLLSDYINDNGLENFVKESYIQLKRRADNMEATAEIIANIGNKTLADQILKYIAPHFYLTKNDELVAV